MLRGDLQNVYGNDEAVGFEVSGNAALYRGPWKISRVPEPLGDGQWHLYNLSTDPGEATDLATVRPDLLQEMIDEYVSYASEVGVIETGPEYNPFKQVQRNAYRIGLQRHWPQILFGLLVMIGLISLIIWGLGRLWRLLRRA